MKRKEEKRPDFILLFGFLLLTVLGLLFLYSASSFWGEKYFNSSYYFLLLQIKKGVLPGLFLGGLLYFLNLKTLKKLSFWIFLAVLILTYLVFIPGLGIEKGGAKRWIDLKILQFQPSEFLKLAFLIYLSAWLSSSKLQKYKNKQQEFYFKLLPFFILLLLASLALIFQPDIGTLGIILALALLLYFLSGVSWWYFLVLVTIISLGGVALALLAPYRIERILVFLNPNLDPLGAGYHLKQSLIGIGSGGLLGKGLGLSQQKLGFLPAPLSDSIFSIIAEEIGFIGVVALISLYLLIFTRTYYLALKEDDSFKRLLAIGIASHITGQAFLNMFALTGLFPLTGLPLPFISLGGTSLTVSLAEAGILLNILKR